MYSILRKAVREAVVNAFYHRGYEPEHNDPVKVRIYSTHIDITSYPGPHQSLQSSHFSADSDMPPVKTRNKRVGGFLVQRKLAEEKGTGVRTIFRSMKRNGNFTPEFQFDKTYFCVRLSRHPKFMVRELLTTANQLVAKGEKQKAVDHLSSGVSGEKSRDSRRTFIWKVNQAARWWQKPSQSSAIRTIYHRPH